MSFITVKGLIGALVLASVGLVVSACNTSKATVDTLGKFTSSTSPASWVNANGVIQESQKARLFAAVAFENLEQYIARGNGEYVRSLAVLMNIPAGEQDQFRSLSQRQYSRLFASDRRTAESLLATLISNRQDLRPASHQLE